MDARQCVSMSDMGVCDGVLRCEGPVLCIDNWTELVLHSLVNLIQ